MKIIGIDARLYFQTGVGVYIRNYLYYLQKHAPDGYQFYIYVLEKDSSQIHFENTQFVKREVHSKWHTISEQLSFCNVLMGDNLDLMHFTYFSYPVLYKRKFIATIHDLTPLIHKTGRASTLPSFMYEAKYQAFKYVLSQQVKNASLLITPTNTVKEQICTTFGEQYKNKIKTVYEGINYEFIGAKESATLKTDIPEKYLLYVGNFYPHKNVSALIEAFRLLTVDHTLILAGPDNYFSHTFEQKLRDEKVTNIQCVHPHSVEDLVYLYKHASALINPSISEGFGLPIIEAMYFNVPIIASDLPVFHELMGDQYTSFNPHDIADIKRAIEECIESPKRPHFKTDTFSFEEMVKEYVHILTEVSRQSNP